MDFFNMADTEHCGKLAVLEKLLTSFEKQREKCLVFSWSTQTLDVIEALLQAKGWVYHRIDGQTAVGTRQQLVDEYNESARNFIFLCSTRAAGVGLNLQSASRVVVFDCNWNPAYDLQAQDRAYRIGQKKNVHVYRLVCQGTVEELMYMRQLYKTSLTSEALDGKKSQRLFEAIEGEKKGELYGLPNLMRFDINGHLHRMKTETSTSHQPGAASFMSSSSSSSSSPSSPSSTSSSLLLTSDATLKSAQSKGCDAESGHEGDSKHDDLPEGLDVVSAGDLLHTVQQTAVEFFGEELNVELGTRSCLNGDFLSTKGEDGRADDEVDDGDVHGDYDYNDEIFAEVDGSNNCKDKKNKLDELSKSQGVNKLMRQLPFAPGMKSKFKKTSAPPAQTEDTQKFSEKGTLKLFLPSYKKKE
jgi:superfamily II DNA/RNA helicase